MLSVVDHGIMSGPCSNAPPVLGSLVGNQANQLARWQSAVQHSTVAYAAGGRSLGPSEIWWIQGFS